MEFIIKNPIIVFFLVINVLAVVFCVADKIKARKRMRRISEKTLFTVSFLGGAVGMYVTMLIIRHKTKHKRFMFGFLMQELTITRPVIRHTTTVSQNVPVDEMRA